MLDDEMEVNQEQEVREEQAQEPSAEQAAVEEEPVAERLMEQAKVQQAVQLYELLTNPDTAASVIQELARQHGLLQQERQRAEREEEGSADWFGLSEPQESQEPDSKLREIEEKLQRLMVYYEQQARRQALQRAVELVKGYARRDGVPLSANDVERIVQEASQLVAPGMSDAQVERLLETSYLAHVHRTARTVQQKKQESVRQPEPVPEVQAKEASGADTLDARIDAVIRRWLAQHQGSD